MKENFPNLVKKTDIQVQKAQRCFLWMDAKRPTLRHIVIKMPRVKDRERILKAAKKVIVSHRGVPLRLSAAFSKEIQARRNGKKYSKS